MNRLSVRIQMVFLPAFVNYCASIVTVSASINALYPPVWFMSYITYYCKKGTAADTNNYRPIGLSATMS